MALEMIGGAVLGVVFDQLRREIGRVKIIATFRPKLQELEETLDLLYPVIKEIEELNKRLNGTDYVGETIMLRRLLEDGTKLVSKCSNIPKWDFLKQSRHREKLMELDNKIVKFIILMQPHMGRDQKQTLLIARETKQMLIMSLNLQGLDHQGFSNLAMGLTTSSSCSSYQGLVHIVLQVKLAWQLCKIKARKRLSTSNGIKSIPREVVRSLREKFVMNTTPTRFEHHQTQLKTTLSTTFSIFTWTQARNFVLRQLRHVSLRTTRYEGREAIDKKESGWTEMPRHGRKSKAASSTASGGRHVPGKNLRHR